MIDVQIYVLGASAVALVLLLGWLTSVWETRKALVPEDILKRFDGTEFEVVAVREVYGAKLIEFSETPREFAHSFEICESGEDSYTRILVDFPTHLPIPLTLMKESSDGIVKRVLSLKEIEIGEPEFDDAFLVLAHNAEEFEEYVDPDLRAKLLELAPLVGELKLGPDGIFIQSLEIVDTTVLRDVLERAHGIANSFYHRAVEIEESRKASRETEETMTYDEGHLGLHARDF